MSAVRRLSRSLGSLALVVALIACSGQRIEPPKVPQELEAELASDLTTRTVRGDFWTERLGDYLPPVELHAYETLEPERRFPEYGERWLEFCLREDLLGEHRWALSPEEIDRVRAAPSYDASAQILREILGARSDE